MQWENEQPTPVPRSSDAVQSTPDEELLGTSYELYSEVWQSIKEYHVKHQIPPPTSSGNAKTELMKQRNAAGRTFKPGCKTGESLKTVCSMHAKCQYYSHHAFTAKAGQMWYCKGWKPHSEDCSRATKTQANKHKKLKKAATEAEVLVQDATEMYTKHKTHKNKVSLHEAEKVLKARLVDLPDSEDCEILENMPKCHTAYMAPKKAAALVVHLYQVGKVPSVTAIRNELQHHVPGLLSDDYIQRVKTQAVTLYGAREMQSLQMMPRLIEALRKKGHVVTMDAQKMEEMKADVAVCLNTEWTRRQMFDSSLPDCQLTADDVMDLDQVISDTCPVVYNNFWSLGINRKMKLDKHPT
jgi:hypothetical protein